MRPPDRSRKDPPVRMVIDKVAFGGAGLGQLPNGKVCFVPGVVPGEVVSVRVIREKKSFAEAELVAVHEASPFRVAAPCPVFGTCGGCQYQHIAYPKQLEIKRGQVEEVLRRLGGLADPLVDEVIPSPEPFGYRNRITVHVRSGKTGFFEKSSTKVVDVAHCPISSEEVNARLAEFRKERHADGEYGLRETSDFRGFRQVNAAAAEKLLRTVKDLAGEGGKLLVDAYCGAGFFAFALQERFERVIGIEWSRDAVRHARESASPHMDFLDGDVALHLAPALRQAPPQDTTLIVDPPAEGLPEEVIDIIARTRPSRMIYISCDPATMARDIKRLGSPWKLVRVTPVDMFPQTAQIECTALLVNL